MLWLLLAERTVRTPLGHVVDLCPHCQQLRFFQIIRLSKQGYLGGSGRHAHDEKWCSGCVKNSPCVTQRYIRPLNDYEVRMMSESQAFEATNASLKARLEFMDQLLGAGEALSSTDRYALDEAIASLKVAEAQGHNTGPWLEPLRRAGKPTAQQLRGLIAEIRAQQAQRATAWQVAATKRQESSWLTSQLLLYGAMAGVGAVLLALLPRQMHPLVVIGGAVGLAVVGSLVIGQLVGASAGQRLTPLVPALMLAGPGAALAWYTHTRALYVDNPSDNAIVVFIDDRKESLQPGQRSKLYINKQASYVLGWGAAGADKPESSITSPIEDDALFNPGSSACYWLQIDVYSASRDQVPSNSEPWGPQPVRELYSFKKIDNWFQDNPETVDLPNSSSTKRRTALKYDRQCMRFLHCSIDVRRELQTCRARALRMDDPSLHEQCLDSAEQQCTAAQAQDVKR